MTYLVDLFECVHEEVVENVIQHDTERKVWNGVDKLRVGHIVTFNGKRKHWAEEGEALLVIAIGDNGKAKLRSRQVDNHAWFEYRDIRPLTRKIDHSGLDGGVMATFAPTKGEYIEAPYRLAPILKKAGFEFKGVAIHSAQFLFDDQIATIPEGYNFEFSALQDGCYALECRRGQITGIKKGWSLPE